MSRLMVCLIGEQPVPNLLPIRHCQPDEVVLAYSDTTERVKDNLTPLLERECRVRSHEIAAWEVSEAKRGLEQCVGACAQEELVFNLTGGTKPMSLAAFLLARERSAQVVYMQSEGSRSLLYSYGFPWGALTQGPRTEIPELLTIDDYLRAHGLIGYGQQPQREPFEQQVMAALQPHVDEIVSGVSRGSLEIDLVIRCGNQVGIAEVKSGKAAERKGGIDQLNTATQREFLGTYTRRFLIVDRPVGTNNAELARAHGIKPIELLDDRAAGLSRTAEEHLIATVTQALGKNR